MNCMPLVSVLMPVYNGSEYLSKAIESVLAQSYRNFELIIVNDGSTDNSSAIIKDYLIDPRIRYIDQQNTGVAAARNAGISIASGELIALLDQDDIWLPDKLILQVMFMKENPDVGLVHTYARYINESSEFMDCREIGGDCYVGWCTDKLLMGNGLLALTVLMKSSLLKQCGGFTQSRAPADDWDLWLRISRLASFGFIADVCAHYRLHGRNESRHLLKMKRAEISVLIDYLFEFKKYLTSWEKYVAERKLVDCYTDAAIIAKTNGKTDDAHRYTINAIKINFCSIWYFYDKFISLLPTKLQSRFTWYRFRILNL